MKQPAVWVLGLILTIGCGQAGSRPETEQLRVREIPPYLKGPPPTAKDAFFSPDNRLLVVQYGPPAWCYVWDLQKSEQLYATFQKHLGPTAFLPTGQEAITADWFRPSACSMTPSSWTQAKMVYEQSPCRRMVSRL
jgi:hypothetical protein